MLNPKILTLDDFKHLMHSIVDDHKYLVIHLNISEIYIDEDERIHRNDDKAAMIDYRMIKDKLNLSSKKWFKHGLTHRDTGPAIVGYHRNGRIRKKEYYINGLKHRIDGPAYIRYDKKGYEETVHFMIKGSLYNFSVSDWIKNNKFNSYKEMTEIDFNQMWMEIL